MGVQSILSSLHSEDSWRPGISLPAKLELEAFLHRNFRLGDGNVVQPVHADTSTPHITELGGSWLVFVPSFQEPFAYYFFPTRRRPTAAGGQGSTSYSQRSSLSRRPATGSPRRQVYRPATSVVLSQSLAAGSMLQVTARPTW